MLNEKDFLESIKNLSYDDFIKSYNSDISIDDFAQHQKLLRNFGSQISKLTEFVDRTKCQLLGKTTDILLHSSILKSKISAIKIIKYLTGWPLTKAKEIIESAPIKISVPNSCDFSKFERDMREYGFDEGKDWSYVNKESENEQNDEIIKFN
jgi:ribosomal protein L7/L12